MNLTIQLKDIIKKYSQPWKLLGILFYYTLGLACAKYLGYSIDWSVFWLGQSAVLMIVLGGNFLRFYYDYVERKMPPEESESSQETDSVKPLPVGTLLQLSILIFSAAAAFVVLLMFQSAFTLVSAIFLGLFFLLVFGYAVSPFRLVYSGYGELAEMLWMAMLTPTLAFLLQAHELHRLMPMVTFPLCALYLAVLLAQELPDFSSDLKYERKTLLLRMGWKSGMFLHNVLILSAYVMIALAALLGLPWQLSGAMILSLPLGILQLVMMIQISNGAKPRWRLLSFTSNTLVFLTAYLMIFTLWTI